VVLRPAVLTHTAAAIEKALKGGVEGIIIANPNNPTGRVWAKEELQKLYASLAPGRVSCRVCAAVCRVRVRVRSGK
jgi:histidinol-phosphate/aromatic aminotransferase/cobyric acid decarboxylase-like protein